MYTVSQLCCYSEFHDSILICCNQLSLKNNFSCELHEPHCKNNYVTHHQQLTDFFTINVKQLLEKHSLEQGENYFDKIKSKNINTINIFNFIYRYPIFLIKYPIFLNALYKKIEQQVATNNEVDRIIEMYPVLIDSMEVQIIKSFIFDYIECKKRLDDLVGNNNINENKSCINENNDSLENIIHCLKRSASDSDLQNDYTIKRRKYNEPY